MGAERHPFNILMFVEDEYEDLELQYPLYRLREAGCVVTVAGPEKGKIYKGKHGYPCKADKSLDEAQGKDFAGLVIPGGYAPDKLRSLPRVLELTRHFYEQGKLLAYICHAGWIPISANILKGARCTSYFTIRDDMENAGAQWVDEAVVVDGNLISSRCPDDLPVFCQAILNYLQKGSKEKETQ